MATELLFKFNATDTCQYTTTTTTTTVYSMVSKPDAGVYEDNNKKNTQQYGFTEPDAV